jgi:type III pantothenate kinase
MWSPDLSSPDARWLALSIGNSRHHWALCRGSVLELVWDSPNHEITKNRTTVGWPAGVPAPASLPLRYASVVPELSPAQTWPDHPNAQGLSLAQIPLQGLYPSLGIDRALAVWGAGVTYGFPVLVIDAGTALTFTGGDAEQRFGGGAILPGLGLQHRMLAQGTAALPQLDSQVSIPPSRWARDTATAIQSGILYTLMAGIHDFVADWLQQYPESQILLTGGDGAYLYPLLQAAVQSRVQPRSPDLTNLRCDPVLGLRGIAAMVAGQK